MSMRHYLTQNIANILRKNKLRLTLLMKLPYHDACPTIKERLKCLIQIIEKEGSLFQ